MLTYQWRIFFHVLFRRNLRCQIVETRQEKQNFHQISEGNSRKEIYIYIYKLSPYDIIYYPYEFAENEKCQFKFFFY